MTIEPRGRVNKFFESVGNVTNMMIDGSVVEERFEIAPPAEEIWSMERVLIVMTAVGMKAQTFGGMVALTNGIRFIQERGGVEVEDFLDGETVKTNADFGLLAGVDNIVQGLPADDLLNVRWTLGKAGFPMFLRGNDQEKLIAVIQDDLTVIGLSQLNATAQGVRVG